MGKLIEATFEKVAKQLLSAKNLKSPPPPSRPLCASARTSPHSTDRSTEPLLWDQFCREMTNALQAYNSRGLAQ